MGPAQTWGWGLGAGGAETCPWATKEPRGWRAMLLGKETRHGGEETFLGTIEQWVENRQRVSWRIGAHLAQPDR